MKTLTSVLSMVLAVTLLPQLARGDDADDLRSLQLTPQIQSILAELRKGTDLDLAAGQSSANPVAPLIALAAALFQETTSGNQQRRPAPRVQAVNTQMLRTTDGPAESAPDDAVRSLMAFVSKVFEAAPHGSEMRADEAARLSPQIQAASPQSPGTDDGNRHRASQAGPDQSVASLMALLNNLLSQASPEERARLDPMVKLIPQVQSMISQLLKEADIDVDNRDGAPANRHGGRGAAGATARDGNSQNSQTEGLTNGTLDGSARMTDQEWRQLFPLRK